MEESSMMINFAWFIGGAVTYRLVSSMLSIKASVEILTQTIVACLAMAKKIDEQSILALQRECSAMKKDGSSEQEIQQSKDLHLQAQNLWRSMLVSMLYTYCPRRYRSIFNLKDWKTAMKILQKK